MNRRILCVDDEPNVLEAFGRSLRKDFEVSVALSGKDGLNMLQTDGPFAVVLSDMRMPELDGIQFLKKVVEIAPQTVRIMLTGNADQQTAVDAVNEGSIFRFLNKPCPPDVLIRTLAAGVEQYRLISSEKELLEQTLNKSLEVLVNILAIVNPTAFSRSTRVKKIAREIADELHVKNAWEIEIAAMLSQIGCITVPEEILQKISNGSPLSNKETGLYHQHPQIGHDLIARIPRMETVADIVADQNSRVNDGYSSTYSGAATGEATLGSRILKVVLDFDKLVADGNSHQDAFHELAGREGWYDLHVFSALNTIVDRAAKQHHLVELGVSDLKPGMVLGGKLISARGSELLPTGQEITSSLILRLTNLVETGIIKNTISVSMPVTQAAVSQAV